MGQSNVVNQFAASTLLLPAIHPEKALRSVFPVSLGPNLTLARGNLLVPPSGTGTNAVQTITAPGSGTYALSGIHPVTGVPFTTSALAFGANDAAVQAALVAALGSGLTSVASLAVSFIGNAGKQPVALMTASAGSVANTTPGVRPGTHTLYAGSGTPTCLLKADVSTDALGNAYYGTGAVGYRRPDAEAYFAGAFYAAEIPNLDANAISTMKARFIAGSLGATGAIIDFP